MHQIFLSYSFRNDRDPLIDAVRAMIECAGFRIEDGKALAGFQVGPEVKKKTSSCKGVVCVVSPEAHATGWVNAEFFQAVGAGHSRIFVLWHDNVPLPNPFQGVAVARYPGTDTLIPITTLAATLGLWAQQLGRTVRAVLLPDAVGRKAFEQNARCEYRSEEENADTESAWQLARLKPLAGGVHAVLPEVPLNHIVQVRLTFNTGQFFTSAFVPQDLRLELAQ